MINKDTNNNLLLFIEPSMKEKLSEPVEDILSKVLKKALLKSEKGVLRDGHFKSESRYKGTHTADDGFKSNNYELLLPNGLVTNSLCVHYLEWYRNSIPDSDFEKLKALQIFMNTFGDDI